jgi:uncharacterized membrane protein YiaA
MTDIMVGGDMNELLSTKMCSPMMIYLGIVVITGLSAYITRNHLKRHNTTKMDNLYNLYSLNELKFIIVYGLVLFGLCQYNKTNLAWIFLMLPIAYILLQNLIVQIHVTSGIQTAPKEIDIALQQIQQQQLYGMNGGKVVPEDTQQSQPKIPAVQVDRPSTTSISQPMGSISGNTVEGYSSTNGSYF